ncbi:MAG: electron transport complex subunit RsxB [Burkholderiaceae bacterium]|jgi:electron transport complex protein RnfB|nr:electron transport complex subunit RsxB [Burkholderiaceae bacterium]
MNNRRAWVLSSAHARSPAALLPQDLAARVLDALPQTQCTRCGHADCAAYAQAVATGAAPINRCPPGGAEGVRRLSVLTGQPVSALDPQCGIEEPRGVAWIDETWCIGCTLCIKACPVDCIVGSNKRMHTVIESQCTGCALCLPACPLDCIVMENTDGSRTGWAAWSPEQAAQARERYEFTSQRRERDKREHAWRLQQKAEHKLAHLTELTHNASGPELKRKRAVIEAALVRARKKA